jgi:hypothetical protein
MNEKENKYALFQLFLMQLSISIALVALDAPFFLILVVPLLVFSPLFFYSLTYNVILLCLYNIIRPILYTWALIITIGGKQDFFAVAFYVIFALQVINMISNFIGSVAIIISALIDKH